MYRPREYARDGRFVFVLLLAVMLPVALVWPLSLDMTHPPRAEHASPHGRSEARERAFRKYDDEHPVGRLSDQEAD